MGLLNSYIDSFKGKKVFFIGLGVSHRRLAVLFAQRGVSLTVCDRLERGRFDERMYGELSALGADFCLGEGYLDSLGDADVIFRSPGISPNNPSIAAAVASGVKLTSEMAGFLEICPCRTIGITGSDGKTTTSTLISEMLKRAGYRVHLGGNIGVPLLPLVDEISPEDFAVVELSSFQLMAMGLSPDIAVVTNIAQNHLDYHTDIDEYIDAKTNIFRYQSADSVAVINADDAVVVSMSRYTAARKRYFSAAKAVERGAYVQGGEVKLATGETVVRIADMRLRGFHNAVNLATVCAAVEGLVPLEAMSAVAREFSGVEHRIEFVRKINGADYYNDSIATTPTRTIAGLRAFDRRVILIAGGYDKHLSFEPMTEDVASRVRLLILCGATADKIESAMDEHGYDKDKLEIVRADNLESAVNIAYKRAQDNDTVLFSPACASFDSFANFEKRGEYFKQLVNGL